jgi:hypothetical protein
MNGTRNTFDTVLKPTLKHFLASNESLGLELKKQQTLTTKLSFAVNKRTTLQEQEIDDTVIKVFGQKNFSEVIDRRMRRLKELNGRCFGQF